LPLQPLPIVRAQPESTENETKQSIIKIEPMENTPVAIPRPLGPVQYVDPSLLSSWSFLDPVFAIRGGSCLSLPFVESIVQLSDQIPGFSFPSRRFSGQLDQFALPLPPEAGRRMPLRFFY
jgi:hypothetical protein